MKERIKEHLTHVFHSAVFSSICLFLALLFAGTSAYLYWGTNTSAPGAARASVDDIVARAGELIVLPTDEAPTLATVSDPEKLKAQPFFAKAQTGDHVLIYAKSAKAVLYRSSTHQIIEVGPIQTGN